MSNLLTTIQSIAVNAVKSTVPVEYCIGTVTSESPLKVRLNDSTLEVWGDTLMLTSAVVERKLTIEKHNHGEDSQLTDTSAMDGTGLPVNFIPAGADPSQYPVNPDTGLPDIPGMGTVLSLNHNHSIEYEVLNAFVTEHGNDELDYEKDNDKIVVTINRALQKGDKVIMIRVCGGQKFVILSRIFKRDDETE